MLLDGILNPAQDRTSMVVGDAASFHDWGFRTRHREVGKTSADAQSMSWQRFRVFSMLLHSVGRVAHKRTRPGLSKRRTHSPPAA